MGRVPHCGEAFCRFDKGRESLHVRSKAGGGVDRRREDGHHGTAQHLAVGGQRHPEALEASATGNRRTRITGGGQLHAAVLQGASTETGRNDDGILRETS